jgi:hypothetical protein
LIDNPSITVSFLALPYTLRFAIAKVKERLPLPGYIPRRFDNRRKHWYKYGNDIKTIQPFKSNLTKILRLSQKKGESILFLTFAYYIPEDYSVERFQKKSLDYVTHHGAIEIWGRPEYVEKAISKHNQIIRELAPKHDHVIFVDQAKLVPKEGRYFNDICHLSKAGTRKFVENILDPIVKKITANISQPHVR